MNRITNKDDKTVQKCSEEMLQEAEEIITLLDDKYWGLEIY
ncbi:hypothetical protein [Clostridium chromiireducens]|nr:hypothetical protein [Clostridium chromiireducens]